MIDVAGAFAGSLYRRPPEVVSPDHVLAWTCFVILHCALRLVGADGRGLTVIPTVRLESTEAAIVLLATFEQADSTPAAFTARTQKYHVPTVSPVHVAPVAVGELTARDCVSASAAVPAWMRKLAKLVSGEPSVLVVGAAHVSRALFSPGQVQVSV